MSLRRCATCGSPNVTAVEYGTYSYTKGAIGVAIFGVGGAVAGVNGKKEKAYKCPDCGSISDHTMADEIRVLIDAGVNSVEAREHLKLRNSSISWEVLRSSYKNIESGPADRQIQAELQSITSNANATRQEFDHAIDILKEKLHKRFPLDSWGWDYEKYSEENPLTVQEYDEICNALYTFVENIPARIPLDQSGMFDDEYRGMPAYFLHRCFADYCILRFQELYCCLPRHYYHLDNTIQEHRRRLENRQAESDFEALPMALPFLRNWGTYVAPKMSLVRKSYKHFFYEYLCLNRLFVSENRIGHLWHKCTWKINEELSVNFLVPRFKKESGKLYSSDLAYVPVFLRFHAEEDNAERMERYFSVYPEKKEMFVNAIKQNEEQERAANERIAEIETQIKELEKHRNELSTTKDRIAANNALMEKLRKKIFGRKKAALEIATLEQENSDLAKVVQSLETKLSEISNLKELLDQVKESIIPRDEVWYEDLIRKMDYFIIWRCVDEVEEGE